MNGFSINTFVTTAGGKFGGNAFGPDGQRRSGQWEAGSRSGEWGADRPDASRDLGGGRLEERVRVPGAGGSIGSGSSGSECLAKLCFAAVAL